MSGYDPYKLINSPAFDAVCKLQEDSAFAMRAVSGLNLDGILSMVDSLPNLDFIANIAAESIPFDDIAELYENGGIVRNDDSSDELCICMEHYSDDIQSDDWRFIASVIN